MKISITTFLVSLLLISALAFSLSETDSSIKTPNSKITEQKHQTEEKPAPQEIIHPPIPEQMTFAGEPVPLNDNDVRERLEKEILSNTFFHSKTLQIIKLANRWKPVVTKILREEGIPEDFFYLAVAESALDNSAISPAGAKGMWQIMASVAKERGLKINSYVDERSNPYKATKAACDYLKDMYELFGSWTNSAAAYNRGKTGLKNALNGQKESSYYDLYLNQETYRYVFRILAYKTILENTRDYGFELSDSKLYSPLDYKSISVDTTINSLPDFAKKYGTTYKMLKRYNPWLDHNAKYMLYVRNGDSFDIHVPK